MQMVQIDFALIYLWPDFELTSTFCIPERKAVSNYIIKSPVIASVKDNSLGCTT